MLVIVVLVGVMSAKLIPRPRATNLGLERGLSTTPCRPGHPRFESKGTRTRSVQGVKLNGQANPSGFSAIYQRYPSKILGGTLSLTFTRPLTCTSSAIPENSYPRTRLRLRLLDILTSVLPFPSKKRKESRRITRGFQ